jgi:YfiH family protein
MKHYINPNWPAPKNIRAYSTTRQDGHSKPPFDSFNLGFSSGDDPEKVKANRQQLNDELNLPKEPHWIKQVHGTVVDCADLAETSVVADASYSFKKNNICVISTADCLPVLFCDRAGTKVAAAHAGWRGLAAGVIEATFKAMEISPQDTLVWLGPAIGPKAFEVGEEVRQQFLQIDGLAHTAFVPSHKSGKWFADLYALAKQRLSKLGVTKIYGGDFCTYTDRERFFSYRRDHAKTGRMLTLIWRE